MFEGCQIAQAIQPRKYIRKYFTGVGDAMVWTNQQHQGPAFSVDEWMKMTLVKRFKGRSGQLIITSTPALPSSNPGIGQYR